MAARGPCNAERATPAQHRHWGLTLEVEGWVGGWVGVTEGDEELGVVGVTEVAKAVEAVTHTTQVAVMLSLTECRTVSGNLSFVQLAVKAHLLDCRSSTL